jgi:hypothetical protein
MDVTTDDVVQVVKDYVVHKSIGAASYMYMYPPSLCARLEMKYGLSNYRARKAINVAVDSKRLVEVGTGCYRKVWLAEDYAIAQTREKAQKARWDELIGVLHSAGYRVTQINSEPMISLPVAEVCRMLGIENPLEG